MNNRDMAVILKVLCGKHLCEHTLDKSIRVLPALAPALHAVAPAKLGLEFLD